MNNCSLVQLNERDGILGGYSESLHTPVHETKSSMRSSNSGEGVILGKEYPILYDFDNKMFTLDLAPPSQQRTYIRSFIRSLITNSVETNQ